MDAWQKTWREGIQPQLGTKALASLYQALVGDDQRLIQGTTIKPVPILRTAEENDPVEACCPVAWCGWMGEGLEVVKDLETWFASVINVTNKILGPFAAGIFFGFWDYGPRDTCRRLLLSEVEEELARRRSRAA